MTLPLGCESTLSQRPFSFFEPVVACPLRELGHSLRAGFPSPATDYVEEALDLNAYLVVNKAATFVFSVRGESMKNAGIHDGDKVIVDRSMQPLHDDIVVAVVHDEYTLKRLYRRAGRVELHPDNPEFEPILFSVDTELQIWGVVVGSIRRYHQQTKPTVKRMNRGK